MNVVLHGIHLHILWTLKMATTKDHHVGRWYWIPIRSRGTQDQHISHTYATHKWFQKWGKILIHNLCSWWCRKKLWSTKMCLQMHLWRINRCVLAQALRQHIPELWASTKSPVIPESGEWRADGQRCIGTQESEYVGRVHAALGFTHTEEVFVVCVTEEWQPVKCSWEERLCFQCCEQQNCPKWILQTYLSQKNVKKKRKKKRYNFVILI